MASSRPPVAELCFWMRLATCPLPCSPNAAGIQERRIRPIGSPQEEPVDVRIISATHKDLGLEVQAGRFRQDLYYRLNLLKS